MPKRPQRRSWRSRWGSRRRLERQHAEGTAPHCFAREILESKESWYTQGLTEEDLAWVAGGLVEAGFETSAATLNSLVLHLAANLRVQKVAQEELMRVVGPDRLPSFADLRELPYVRACVKEMLRMNPILAPGIRHYADSDVVYKGTYHPEGHRASLRTRPFCTMTPVGLRTRSSSCRSAI